MNIEVPRQRSIANEERRDNWIFFVYSVILTSSTHIYEKQSCLHLGLIIKGVVQDIHGVETKDYILMESQIDISSTWSRVYAIERPAPSCDGSIYDSKGRSAHGCFCAVGEIHRLCSVIGISTINVVVRTHVTHNYLMFIYIQNS